MISRSTCLYLTLTWSFLWLSTEGCLLGSRKQSGRSRSGNELIIRDSIYLDRIADGVAARLQFKAVRPVVCELGIYTQDPNAPDAKETPVRVPCSSPDKPRLEITERLENFAKNIRYYLMISAWDPAIGKSSIDVVTVRENLGDGTGGDQPGNDEVLKELLVARLDIPLRSAEFHHHVLKKQSSVLEIRRSLQRNEGCVVGVPAADLPYRETSGPMPITNLATRDLAGGSASVHRDHSQRLNLQYSDLNRGLDKWSLLYQQKGRDVQAIARPVAAFASLMMTSGQTYNFDAPTLTEATDPFRIDPNFPLKFSWTSTSPWTPGAYVTIQIGRSNAKAALYCIAPADAANFAISPQLLANLPADKYVLAVELHSDIVLPKEGWLVSASDWRSGRIEK